ncbi:MAG: response regulator [Melioribacteraceae bacterium]|nr:response regulator [Melioribacteraceae bacterium]MCF8356159.1 response regulator [Melioribacteraceae bacterium]MCF8392325.1 response regulator [Melioribacteraceae bacterium]MCF8417657.1 response regulator [Melioribacteraceae bacterium]
MPLFITAIIVFILADILIRYFLKKSQEKKLRKERESVLQESLNLDYSKEAVSLKRAEVDNPKAKILCVDDESVILDSFRKILVLDGYSVDTVEQGGEALNLIKSNHYDFVFTDLKMPEMDGVEVTKAVKYLRPDIDVIIITGYATVETAVNCMKYGAMDYVQKPFTEDELLEFTKNSLIKRQDRIHKELKPRVHVAHLSEPESIGKGEFAIPGGVFISDTHTWASVEQDGTVKVGLDDFAKKLIGSINKIDFPNLGMKVQKGQILFSIKQGQKTIPFKSPISGSITKINQTLNEDLEVLDISPYDKNWICVIDADQLDIELHELKIGKTAVALYQEDIDYCIAELKKLLSGDQKETNEIYIGALQMLEDKNWNALISDLFKKDN